MERRDALRKMSLAMGGVLSASTMTAVLTRCSERKEVEITGQLQFFNDDQFQIIHRIVERTIPATNTPGAVEAKVPEFIDMMLAECYDAVQQAQFQAGLKIFDESLSKAENADTKDSLQKALEEFEKEMKHNEQEKEASFFIRTVKELTLLGYFTSEAGASQALRYVTVPGRFDPCIPYNNEPAWAFN